MKKILNGLEYYIIKKSMRNQQVKNNLPLIKKKESFLLFYPYLFLEKKIKITILTGKIGVSNKDPTPILCHVVLTRFHWTKLKSSSITTLSTVKYICCIFIYTINKANIPFILSSIFYRTQIPNRSYY